MTREEIAVIIERAEFWPQEAQKELLQSASDIEKKYIGVYRLNDEERADIDAALGEIRCGEVATEAEVHATFKKLRGK